MMYTYNNYIKYIETWFSSITAVMMPYNYFMLLQQIYNFKITEKNIAYIALKITKSCMVS